jgi:hypothetical protein
MYGPAFWYDNELPPPTALAQMYWHVTLPIMVVGRLDVLGLAVGGAPAVDGQENSAKGVTSSKQEGSACQSC